VLLLVLLDFALQLHSQEDNDSRIWILSEPSPPKERGFDFPQPPSERSQTPKFQGLALQADLSGEEKLFEKGHVRSHVWGIWESSSHGIYGPQQTWT
jgi:hypothetical protein